MIGGLKKPLHVVATSLLNLGSDEANN